MEQKKSLLERIVCAPANHPVTDAELKTLERHLDDVWERLGLDIGFTKHFKDRVNDARNGRQISVCELQKLFDEVYEKYGHLIAMKKLDFEGVLADKSTDIHIPFVLAWDDYKERPALLSKTIMRKKNFHTDNHEYVVEGAEELGFSLAGPPSVAPIPAPYAADDVEVGIHQLQIPGVLERLNGFVTAVADRQYINPYYAIHTLWQKLQIVGLTFDIKAANFNCPTGSSGVLDLPLKQFGDRTGQAPNGDWKKNNALEDKFPCGLVLHIQYVNTGGIYTLNAEVVQGSPLQGFLENSLTEGIFDDWGVADPGGKIHRPFFEKDPLALANKQKGMSGKTEHDALKSGGVFFKRKGADMEVTYVNGRYSMINAANLLGKFKPKGKVTIRSYNVGDKEPHVKEFHGYSDAAHHISPNWNPTKELAHGDSYEKVWDETMDEGVWDAFRKNPSQLSVWTQFGFVDRQGKVHTNPKAKNHDDLAERLGYKNVEDALNDGLILYGQTKDNVTKFRINDTQDNRLNLAHAMRWNKHIHVTGPIEVEAVKGSEVKSVKWPDSATAMMKIKDLKEWLEGELS